MQNEQNRDYSQNDPWNQDTYQTGSTKPPRSRGGLIAVLLVLVILLSGAVTLLGIVNIRLFRQINREELEETLPPRLEVNTSEIPANKKETVDEEENKKKTQNTV